MSSCSSADTKPMMARRQGERLTPDDTAEVLEELLPAQSKAYELGMSLKLPEHEVETIHRKCTGSKSRILYVIITYLNQEELRPTWKSIVEALKSPSVNLKGVARRIEEIHCHSSDAQSDTSTAGESYLRLLLVLGFARQLHTEAARSCGCKRYNHCVTPPMGPNPPQRGIREIAI